MSLQGIFDPMVRAYFKNKYGGSSGGGGGATTAVWRKGAEYPALENGSFKISDATPTAEELTGGFVLLEFDEAVLPYHYIVDTSQGVPILAFDKQGKGEYTTVAAVFTAERFEQIGMDASNAGFLLTLDDSMADVNAIWFCWEAQT